MASTGFGLGAQAGLAGLLTVIIGAITEIATGVALLRAHYAEGVLWVQVCPSSDAGAWSGLCPSHLPADLGHIATGLIGLVAVAAVFSPGLSRLKLGVFARPPAP